MALFLSSSFFLTSCDDDDEATPDAPIITAPSSVASVAAGGSTDINFTVSVPAGFSRSSVTAVNGSATISSDLTAGATSGTVTVSFTAGTTAGAATVTLSVTDTENRTVTQTAAVSVAAEETVIRITANITSDQTWETGKTYILDKRIAVEAGVKLTIQEGVVVKGEFGSGANASALVIARGAKLDALGTAASPIIFTSIADEIQPGQIESPNLSPTENGLWGGLLILGNAPISADAEAVQIEGIPANDTNGLFGGTNPSESSGTIRYISIRHGGANIGEGNEINGLTLGGVGTGTTIEYVEVIANQDDGIEWFGGGVSVKHAVVWNTGDDAIDTDQSWTGTLDNFVVISPGDECFELDGPEGALLANNTHTIQNGSVRATANGRVAQGLVDLDANTYVDMKNVYFFDLTDGQDFDLLPQGIATVSNLQATIPAALTIADFFKDGSDAAVTSVARGANTVGADLSQFNGWSWTAVSGALSEF